MPTQPPRPSAEDTAAFNRQWKPAGKFEPDPRSKRELAAFKDNHFWATTLTEKVMLSRCQRKRTKDQNDLVAIMAEDLVRLVEEFTPLGSPSPNKRKIDRLEKEIITSVDELLSPPAKRPRTDGTQQNALLRRRFGRLHLGHGGDGF
jgi:hypothetical protein